MLVVLPQIERNEIVIQELAFIQSFEVILVHGGLRLSFPLEREYEGSATTSVARLMAKLTLLTLPTVSRAHASSSISQQLEICTLLVGFSSHPEKRAYSEGMASVPSLVSLDLERRVLDRVSGTSAVLGISRSPDSREEVGLPG